MPSRLYLTVTSRTFLLLILSLNAILVHSQELLHIQVSESITLKKIPGVTVSADGKAVGMTDSTGLFVTSIPAGKYQLLFSSKGYLTERYTVIIPGSSMIEIQMKRVEQELDAVTVVASTRNNQPIESSPLKVEILGKEDMDEENTIKPGNIASILGDISGVQIQQSSATSGNSNVRIQGLEGRYTQILRDGLPLFEGFSGGFGVLSIPPLDLRQVELIKGSASTLYGGGAIGGLINLVSRKPSREQEATFTLNATTLKEINVNGFGSKRNDHFGYTIFAGYTKQSASDVNADGFSDVPDLDAFIIHPKLFFYPSRASTIAVGYSAIFEKRSGGDMQVLQKNAGNTHQYFENNHTRRQTTEFVFDQYLAHHEKMQVKASVSQFNREIITNIHSFEGKQTNYFTEASILKPIGEHSFVGGINVSGDNFKIISSDPVRLVPFSNNVVGVFAQFTTVLKETTTIEAGIRYDYHNTYGGFLLPRIAIFHRFNEHWGTRAGLGLGYKTPDPLSQQIIEIPIQDIPPVPSTQVAEGSLGANAEINYKSSWGEENSFFINHAFFITSIHHPVLYSEVGGLYESSNASDPVISKGFDTYIQLAVSSWEIYLGYTYTIAERTYLETNKFIPLTPKNRAAFTLVKGWGDSWRLGLEASYTGKQHRFDYSYTPGYVFMAAMIEHRFGKHFSVVLNGENLLDYRQSKEETLYTGSISDPQFKPLWAPIDGRVINFSIRLKI